jgi:hypothetical protein
MARVSGVSGMDEVSMINVPANISNNHRQARRIFPYPSLNVCNVE